MRLPTPIIIRCLPFLLVFTATTGEPRIPSSPGHHRCTMTATVLAPAAKPGEPEREVKIDVPYSLYLPRAYFAGGTCPLLACMHGLGERGTDLNGVYLQGPDPNLFNPALSKIFPFIVVSPQCPMGRTWTDALQSRVTVACIDHVIRQFRVDRDRVYLTGLSLGGTGVWSVATTAPDRFAAIAPLSGRAWDNPDATAKRLKDVPTWIIAGANDGDFTIAARQMGAAFMRNGNTVVLSVVPGADHFVFNRYYDNPTFYAWFLGYRRGASATEKPDAVTQARIDALLAAGRKLPAVEADRSK